jgi:GT2 family glycosyltransferase
MSKASDPSIAIVIATRNRPDSLERCLKSVDLARSLAAELIVVDQSDDSLAPRVKESVESLVDAKYVRSVAKGVSIARNVAISNTKQDYILFTDDDCEVKPSWLRAWSEALSVADHPALAFGRVVAPPVEEPNTFTPVFEPTAHPCGNQFVGFLLKGVTVGMGANMAVSRQAWADVGGFDEILGAGAPFPAAEECDFAIRVMAVGRQVAYVTAPTVIHWGSRSMADACASELLRGYALGMGAMLAKHARCGSVAAVLLVCSEVLHRGWCVFGNLLHGNGPVGGQRIVCTVKGVTRSLRYRIDKDRWLYVRTLCGEV